MCMSPQQWLEEAQASGMDSLVELSWPQEQPAAAMSKKRGRTRQWERKARGQEETAGERERGGKEKPIKQQAFCKQFRQFFLHH